MNELVLGNTDPEVTAELYKLTGQDPAKDDLDLDAIAELLRKAHIDKTIIAKGSNDSIAYIKDKLGVTTDKPIDAQTLLLRIGAERFAARRASGQLDRTPVAASRSGRILDPARDSARRYAEKQNRAEEQARQRAAGKP